MKDKEKTFAERMEDPADREEWESIIEGVAMAQAAICTQVKEKARQKSEALQKQTTEK